MTANEILQNVTSLRSRLAELIVMATALGQQVTGHREALKLVEDAIVVEIWENPLYKNDRVRNEQKHLARINDTRYTEVADLVSAGERDRAECYANILSVQNELHVATVQYQAAHYGEHIAGVRFAFQVVPYNSNYVESGVELKPQMMTEMATAPEEDLPAMARAVLQANPTGTPHDQLSNLDRKICEIVASGETRFLDGAALSRVRGLYHVIKPATGDKERPTVPMAEALKQIDKDKPTTAPVEDQPQKTDTAQAPYLKPSGESKPAEKIGGIKIN